MKVSNRHRNFHKLLNNYRKIHKVWNKYCYFWDISFWFSIDLILKNDNHLKRYWHRKISKISMHVWMILDRNLLLVLVFIQSFSNLSILSTNFQIFYFWIKLKIRVTSLEFPEKVITSCISSAGCIVGRSKLECGFCDCCWLKVKKASSNESVWNRANNSVGDDSANNCPPLNNPI